MRFWRERVAGSLKIAGDIIAIEKRFDQVGFPDTQQRHRRLGRGLAGRAPIAIDLERIAGAPGKRSTPEK